METMEVQPTKVNPYSKWFTLHIQYIQTRFSSCFLKFMSWILYYICFCKAAVFVSGLVFSHKLVDYTLLHMLTTYFADYSPNNMSLQKAAILTTTQEVLSATMVIVATWNSYNSPTRPLKIMLFSTISYTIGLFVLYFVTSPGDPEGILMVRESQGIFITGIISGIILLAVGEAGVKPLIRAFLMEQIKHHNERNENFNKRNETQKENQIKAQERVWWFLAWGCGVVTAYRNYNLDWKPTFKWTGIAMAISLFLFSLGYLSYHCKELTFHGKPFIIFRVIRASLQRRNLNYPCSTDQYHRTNSEDEEEKSYILPDAEGKFYVSPKIKFLRWLDKAAVIESSSTLHPQQQNNAGRLCTVSEVGESKLLLKLFPMWSCFLVFGLVLSAGNTFFPEQGNDLQSEQFLAFVLIFRQILGGTISYLLNLSIRQCVPENKRRQAQIVRIWMGMVIPIFCCIVAWRVQVRIRKMTGATIPMSIFWLVPQFCLLGLMEGLAVDGLDEYIGYHFPQWMNDHVSAINEFVIGIGSCLHISFFVITSVWMSTIRG